MLIRDAELPGRGRMDVRLRGGRIAEIGPRLKGRADVDGYGGALLPGLHDHHVHLTALAAADLSVRVGPGEVRGGPEALAAALRAAGGPGQWVRATGYHESVAGDLDRAVLDRMIADRPVRVQHRSGELWMLNSAALRAAGLDGDGRLWRADDLLRDRLPPLPLDLAAVGRAAAARGITGFTNADPYPAPDLVARLAVLPQRVTVMGRTPHAPVKIVLDDLTLPAPDALAALIRSARPRPVAVHCVTRVQLFTLLLAWRDSGTIPGDRVEHGAVIPDEALPWLRGLGVTVVTQPHFPVERAEAYATQVHPDDRPHLYRARTLAAAGIPLAAGTDAPYGTPDPWAVMRAATTRPKPERLTSRAALRLFTGSPRRPSRPRRIAVDAPADLCLLHVPLREALTELSADTVRAVFIGGRPAAM